MIKALLFLVASCFAQEKSIYLQTFQGLNDAVPAATIGQNQAQDLLNVEASRAGNSLVKRAGFSQEATMSVTTAPISGSFQFTTDSGNFIRVVCNDTNCAQSTNFSTFSNFLTTATATTKRWSFVSVDGDLYGANDSRDKILKYDGVTSSHPVNIPRGSILELTEERMIVANTSASPGRVHYSKAGDFIQFDTASLTTDPWFDDLGSPGEGITALKYYQGILYVYKSRSITACELGDQYTTRCEVIVDSIGADNNTSFVSTVDGLYFKGSDKNFYKIVGREITQISQAIPTLIQSQSSGKNRSNLQTTQDDWNAGTQDPSGSWDTTRVFGSVIDATSTVVYTSDGDFVNTGTAVNTTGLIVTNSLVLSTTPGNNFLNLSVATFTRTGTDNWSINGDTATYTTSSAGIYSFSGALGTSTGTLAYGDWSIDMDVGSVCANCREKTDFFFISNNVNPASTDGYMVRFDYAFGTSACYLYRLDDGGELVIDVDASVTGTNLRYSINRTFAGAFTVTVTDIDTGLDSNCHLEATDTTYSESSFANLQAALERTTTGTGPNFVTFDNMKLAGTYVSAGSWESPVFNTGFSTPIAGPVTISSSVPAGTNLYFAVHSATSSTGAFNAYQAIGNSTQAATNMTRQYWQFKSTFTTSVTSSTPRIDDITLLAATTGQFISQCIQPGPNVTSYGIIFCDMTSTGHSAINLFTRSSNTCTNLSGESWTAQTNNAAIQATARAALQFRGVNDIKTSSETTRIDSCITYWVDGVLAPPTWGLYDSKEQDIFWTYAVNQSSTNNRFLKYDIETEQWYPWSLNFNAPILIDGTIYAGDSQAGKWYQFGNANTDNGAAINSYWKSKDFSGGDPFQESNFSAMSVIAKNEQGGSVTVDNTYGSGATSSYSISLSTDSTKPYIRHNYAMPFQSPHSFLNFKIGNNAANEPFEILGVRIDLIQEPWRVLTP